jgi:hypothetical protein
MRTLQGFKPNGIVVPEFIPCEYFDQMEAGLNKKKGSAKTMHEVYVRDYIEELPTNIDVEIGEQLIKLQRCQIDNVGVYSYKCRVKKKQNNILKVEGDIDVVLLDDEPDVYTNVLMNISTVGITKHISFESQLLIANNLSKSITLVFHFKEMNDQAIM